jgi:hypothetical protein
MCVALPVPGRASCRPVLITGSRKPGEYIMSLIFRMHHEKVSAFTASSRMAGKEPNIEPRLK